MIGWLSNLVLAVVAYLLAFVLFVIDSKLAAAPQGVLVDESMRPAFFFVVLALTVGLLLLPLFNATADSQTKSFGFFTAVFLVIIVVARAFHVIALDPNAPIDKLLPNLLHPFRH